MVYWTWKCLLKNKLFWTIFLINASESMTNETFGALADIDDTLFSANCWIWFLTSCFTSCSTAKECLIFWAFCSFLGAFRYFDAFSKRITNKSVFTVTCVHDTLLRASFRGISTLWFTCIMARYQLLIGFTCFCGGSNSNDACDYDKYPHFHNNEGQPTDVLLFNGSIYCAGTLKNGRTALFFGRDDTRNMIRSNGRYYRSSQSFGEKFIFHRSRIYFVNWAHNKGLKISKNLYSKIQKKSETH